jgi:hypothetical protein
MTFRCRSSLLGIGYITVLCVVFSARAAGQIPTFHDLEVWESDRVLALADSFLTETPRTVTSKTSLRSAGGGHDFFSEADYWWPDPTNVGGPYVRKDGYTNPDIFVAHRTLLRSMSVQVSALVAAYKISGCTKYADHAMAHLRAWCLDGTTRMAPHFKYAQAIAGVCSGRAAGTIDGIHLVEVAQSARVLARAGYLAGDEYRGLQSWFRDLMFWLTTHPYGKEERDSGNNHAVCWLVQVASYALFLEDRAQLASCADFYRNHILPEQVAGDGSFPRELARTKPFGYSLFTMDAVAMLCQILHLAGMDLFTYQLPDGRCFQKSMEYMLPFIQDRAKWDRPPDVMYHECWPVRHPALLFAGMAYCEPRYILVWKSLDADPVVDEIVRNFPYRQPVLWVE